MPRIWKQQAKLMDPTGWRFQQTVDSHLEHTIPSEDITLPRLVSHVIYKDLVEMVGKVRVVTRQRVVVSQIRNVKAEPCAYCGEPNDLTARWGERLCPDCLVSLQDGGVL